MTTNRLRLLAAVGLVTAVLMAVTLVHGRDQSAPKQAMPPDMPGMAMLPTIPAGAPGSPASAASPSGYAPIALGHDVEQRIGVTVGKVEETPLTMTVRAVGIVRPDETRVAHVHLKTEGWVE